MNLKLAETVMGFQIAIASHLKAILPGPRGEWVDWKAWRTNWLLSKVLPMRQRFLQIDPRWHYRMQAKLIWHMGLGLINSFPELFEKRTPEPADNTMWPRG